ncbi:MAG: hypothetical protein R3271_11245 [Methylophaga sp.]|jgi:uncharacterized membrane protein (Fun14 family)|uniref:hypothetical protein n=1 Tax=Methylophaga sp. TaxID=2024840 RepID=UPI00299F0F61|nr:hypothetical protein [Methylophaga sp.]MDX1750884.1 hypothetical protein [Methylophaga sp.]
MIKRLWAKKYIYKAVILLVGIILLMTTTLAVTTIVFNLNEQVSSLSGSIEGLKNKFTLFRWSVLGLIIVFWPQLINLIAKYYDARSEQVDAMKNRRWRYAALFIAFDLIVIEALPGRLLGL